MTQFIDLQSPLFLNTFYEQQLQGASAAIHDYFLVSNPTGLALEKKGDFCLVFLWKKIFGTSYVVEESVKQIVDLVIKKQEHVDNSLEAMKLSKTCFIIKQIVSHVIEKRTNSSRRDISYLQEIKQQLESLEFDFLKNAAAKDNVSPFLCACTHEMFSHAISLIDKTTDLREAFKYYPSLLKIAYQQDKQELCLKFIELGANPKEAFTENSTFFINSLLATAISNHNTAVITPLINSGTDLNQPINEQKERLLHLACKEGLEETVQILCAKGANCNHQDRQGNTALHAACLNLQLNIALLLNARGADASIINREGISAFSLPSLCPVPHLQSEIKEFYTTLFRDVPLAIEKITPNGFTHFIDSSYRRPQDLIKNTIKTSPFEIPLLLQDKLLAQNLVAKFSREEFSNSLEKLRQKYPHTALDLIEFSHISLSTDHLKYTLPEITITAPQKPVNLNELLIFFEKITFTDKKSPYFLNSFSLKNDIKNRSRDELKNLIYQVIHRIENRIEFIGTPKKGTIAIDNFYEIIENSLKTIILFFQESLEDNEKKDNAKAHQLISFFSELLRSADQCAGRYFLTAVTEHNKICKGFSPTFEDEILVSLSEYRRILLHSCINLEKEHNANEYGYILRNLGKELGLPEATVMSSYIDQYGWVDQDKIKTRFFELYTPHNIQKGWIEPLLKENGNLREKFIDWMKEHIPNNWKKELLEERTRVYLATEVFDMSTGQIKPSAVTHLLTHMESQIFYSSFKSMEEEDTVENNSFLSQIGNLFPKF